jgi:hypothetical protein
MLLLQLHGLVLNRRLITIGELERTWKEVVVFGRIFFQCKKEMGEKRHAKMLNG